MDKNLTWSRGFVIIKLQIPIKEILSHLTSHYHQNLRRNSNYRIL